MSEYKLSQEIILRSEADTWDEAKLEWKLAQVYYVSEAGTCLCGHSPIIEICVLHNKYNDNDAIVGNVCVKKFLGLSSDKIFQAVNRVSKDNEKALNAETIAHAHRRGWISDWDRNFYSDTIKKSKNSIIWKLLLSPKELAKRIEVNQKVIKRIVKSSIQ